MHHGAEPRLREKPAAGDGVLHLDRLRGADLTAHRATFAGEGIDRRDAVRIIVRRDRSEAADVDAFQTPSAIGGIHTRDLSADEGLRVDRIRLDEERKVRCIHVRVGQDGLR